jgi:hypothetical protein
MSGLTTVLKVGAAEAFAQILASQKDPLRSGDWKSLVLAAAGRVARRAEAKGTWASPGSLTPPPAASHPLKVGAAEAFAQIVS